MPPVRHYIYGADLIAAIIFKLLQPPYAVTLRYTPAAVTFGADTFAAFYVTFHTYQVYWDIIIMRFECLYGTSITGFATYQSLKSRLMPYWSRHFVRVLAR